MSHHAGLLRPDTLTEAGAKRHKRMIESFWAKHSKTVRVWLEPVTVPNGKPNGGGLGQVYQLRSDMVNGWPRE